GGRGGRQPLDEEAPLTSSEPLKEKDVVSTYSEHSFDLLGHASVARGGFCLFSLKDFPFVLVINLLYFPLDVVEDALAQGAEGLGLMQNEDHQVLGNKQKLEEDASDCTRVDGDGVEFSPEGGDYFPTMEHHTFYEDALDRFLTLAELLNMENIKGAGLDELKRDLSTEESVAHKCKDSIVENEHEIMSLCGIKHFLVIWYRPSFLKAASESSHFVLRANIEPNKADQEEVAELDLDQLPTSASIVLVSSIRASLGYPQSCHVGHAPCLTNTNATDSGPEPSFDRPAISGVPFWHRMSPSDCLDPRYAPEDHYILFTLTSAKAIPWL
nr:hypothetical protein [Tanacetum cinerariifolium]